MDSVGVVSGLMKCLAVVTLSISCLWWRGVWLVFPLKIIEIALFPVDFISSCDQLLAVKTKTTSCKCFFEISFLNIAAFLAP